MKYITITSKHHDGFAMFDSKVSDYNIVVAHAVSRRTSSRRSPRSAASRASSCSSTTRSSTGITPITFPRGRTGHDAGAAGAGRVVPRTSSYMDASCASC